MLETILNLVIGILFLIAFILYIKIFVDEFKYVSKSYSALVNVKSSRFFNSSFSRNRSNKTSVPFGGGRSTYKDKKSKSLREYDVFRIESFKRN